MQSKVHSNEEDILVAGGAGYIGSHMVKMSLQKQYHVVILDDLSSGYRDAVPGGDFILGSLADTALLNRLFAEHHFAGVMHFASFIQVDESMLNPSSYYSVSQKTPFLDSDLLNF